MKTVAMPLSVLLVSLAISTVAFAAPDGARARMHGPAAVIEQLDANKDGFISKEEAAKSPRFAERFDAIDADKDGKVSQAELIASVKVMHEKMRDQRMSGDKNGPFQKLDTDGSGTISKAEALGHKRLEANFDKLDLNQDGQLSKEELRSAHQQMREMRKGEQKVARAGSGKAFQLLDKDGSGGLSREEVSSRPRLSKAFDLIDSNKDGQLSADELKAHHERTASQMKS
jgi:Ca2+-binding EF-hand superfamily protein